MSRAYVALALTLPPALLGCDARTSRERQGAAEVVRAEERLRAADNSQKGRLLGALSTPCVGAEACETQRICRAAYRLHVDALSLTAAAKDKLDAGHGDEAARLLGSAEEKLKQAQADVTTCTEHAHDLRRRYKL